MSIATDGCKSITKLVSFSALLLALVGCSDVDASAKEEAADSGDVSSMVIDGEPSDYQWMAYLSVHKANETACSAALLSGGKSNTKRRWLLTAKHCLKKVQICDDAHVGNATTNQVMRIVATKSPALGATPDVALVELDSQLPTSFPTIAYHNALIAPTAAPQSGEIVGFGIDNQQQINNQNKGNVELQHGDLCKDVPNHTSAMYCVGSNGVPNTGGSTKIPGICHGDSGGPFLMDFDSEPNATAMRLVGVASELPPAHSCGVTTSGYRLATFTPVDEDIAKWIESVMNLEPTPEDDYAFCEGLPRKKK